MTLFTKQDCKPGRNIRLEKLNAEQQTAQLLIHCRVTPFFLLWKLRVWGKNLQTFFALPSLCHSANSFPFFLLSFPSSLRSLLCVSFPLLSHWVCFQSGGKKRFFWGASAKFPLEHVRPNPGRPNTGTPPPRPPRSHLNFKPTLLPENQLGSSQTHCEGSYEDTIL